MVLSGTEENIQMCIRLSQMVGTTASLESIFCSYLLLQEDWPMFCKLLAGEQIVFPSQKIMKNIFSGEQFRLIKLTSQKYEDVKTQEWKKISDLKRGDVVYIRGYPFYLNSYPATLIDVTYCLATPLETDKDIDSQLEDIIK